MPAKRTGGLGRGLDALIPAKKQTSSRSETKNKQTDVQKTDDLSSEKKTTTGNKIKEENKSELVVKISSVEPNRQQPRKKFNEDALHELAESIKQYGILQPLLVSKKEDYYEIIAGERRWRAAKLAGLKEIPIIIKEFSEQEKMEIALIENIQREDLNPIEEAMAYKQLMEDFSLRQDEIANRVSKSRTAVTNAMRLLKLDKRVQQMVIDEMISSGHARAILAVSAKEEQYSIALQVFDHKLSVRETEKLVRNLTKPQKNKIEKDENSAEQALYESIEEKIKHILGTKVVIQRKQNDKGKIEIEYYSKEELERILDLIGSIEEGM